MCDQCEKAQAPTDHERQQQVLDYAWNWFAYHATQRHNMFNYSLVATSLLLVGVGGALANGQTTVAAPLSFVGAAVAVSFCLIDCRNSALVKRSEEVLEAIEGTMFSSAGTLLERRAPRTPRRAPKSPAPKDTMHLRGILTEDLRTFPDRFHMGETGSRREWVEGCVRDWWLGKHGVHLRLIQLLIACMFIVGGVTAVVKPDVLMGRKGDADATRVVDAVNGVSTAVGNLDQRMMMLSSNVAQIAADVAAPPAPPPPAAPAVTSPAQEPQGAAKSSSPSKAATP